MFLSLLQLPANINLEGLDPQALENLQKAGVNIDVNALTNAVNNPVAQQAVGNLAWLAGGMFVAVGILGVIGLVICILHLINVYHWGMTDKAVFDRVGEDKKKWFIVFFIVPIIAGAVMIIPFLGWVASQIIYIYWIVMVLLYFFSKRKKLA